MLRILLLPSLLLAALMTCAQKGSIVPAPVWKAGERRQVSITEAIRFTMDSVNYNIIKSSSYTLEVLAAAKYDYVLGIRTGTTDLLVKEGELQALLDSTKQDSLKRFLQTWAEGAYKPLEGLQSRFTVTLAGEITAPVDPVGTVEALRPALAKVVKNMGDAVAEFRGIAPAPLPSARVDYLSDSLYAVLVRSQVPELHRLLRVYGTTFPLTGSQKEKVTVKEVRSPLRYQYMDLPAMVEAGLDIVDAKKMTGRTITTYDTDALFTAMTKDKWTTEAKPANLSLVEECVTGFDRNTTWPTSSTSETEFRCGAFRMHITTKTAYEVVR